MFPKIQAFLAPLKSLPAFWDEDSGANMSFFDTMTYALDLYPMEFDDPAEHDDPQEFADTFHSDALFASYEEDSPEYRNALLAAFHSLCVRNGINVN